MVPCLSIIKGSSKKAVNEPLLGERKSTSLVVHGTRYFILEAPVRGTPLSANNTEHATGRLRRHDTAG